jgi:hypothetical protein
LLLRDFALPAGAGRWTFTASSCLRDLRSKASRSEF